MVFRYRSLETDLGPCPSTIALEPGIALRESASKDLCEKYRSRRSAARRTHEPTWPSVASTSYGDRQIPIRLLSDVMQTDSQLVSSIETMFTSGEIVYRTAQRTLVRY